MYNEEMSFGKMVLAALVAALVFVGAFIVTLPAFAEEARTVFVIGFDFTTAEVILEDEDGFIWSCPFGTEDWAIGEEYQLIFTEDGTEIWE